MSELLFGLAILSVVWGVVSSIKMASFLSQRGTRINLLFFKIMVLKYVSQYCRMTRQENGRPGPWFYSYILSMNLALVLVIIGLVVRSV